MGVLFPKNTVLSLTQAQNNPLQLQTPPCPAQSLVSLIEREKFFGNPEITGAQLSPDSRYLAFIKPIDGILNLWVKPLNQPFSNGWAVTQATDRSIFRYFWSRDGRYLLYFQDQQGNENFHLYAISPDTPADPARSPRNLTPLDGVRATVIALPEATPDRLLIGLNDRDRRYYDVYRLNLHTGKRDRLYTNNHEIESWIADWDGNLRLAVRPLNNGGSELLRIEGSGFVPILRCTLEETCRPLGFHRDNQRVYLASNQGETVDLTRLVLLNPQTGTLELVESDPQGEVDFGRALFSAKTRELLATFYVGDRLRIYPKTKEFARDLAYLRQQFPEGDLGIDSMTDDGRYCLVGVYSDIDPGSVYLFERTTRNLKKLYQLLPQLDRAELAPMQPLRYQARDGAEIPAYLTLPKGLPPRNLPVIVLPHGGPWARDTWGYDAFAQFLANRGYAVFQPNFRGSTGYGKAFLNAGNRQWGTGVMQQDLTDGVKYLIEQGVADPKRVGIFGISYGGYATLAGLAFTPDLYAVGVSFVGPSNLFTLYESLPPYWEAFRTEFKLRVGNPEDPSQVEQLRQQSPLFSAHKIQAPLMVIQGANDPRVKQAESDQIVAALRDLNRRVEYLLAEDEGHGFAGETNRIAAAAAIERFFAEHLGGRWQQSLSDPLKERLKALSVDINQVAVPKHSRTPSP
ncbi:MAG: S9 family peptidase [Chloroflexaceae bacterium]|nr:S9 family peptidase [Chloroflexaceae bacterium]